MPMNAADDSSIKKVLRIALVGIRSADQVMLKGYLRVILRLEADLEWVSANSPNIDLFVINDEFRHADSVVKLLHSKTDTAALYVDRAANGQGSVAGDTLVLPLKEVNELSGWLYAHIASLGGNPQAVPKTQPKVTPTNSAPPSSSTAQTTTQATAQPTGKAAQPRTLDEVLQSRAGAASASAQPTNPTPSVTAGTKASSPAPTYPSVAHITANTSQRRAFIQLICQLHDRRKAQDRIWVIQNLDGQAMVYFSPKHQKIYITPDHLAFTVSSDWQLATTATLPNEAKPYAQDMVQWLWQQALNHTELLAPVIDSLPTSTLSSWVKPQADNQRHDRLLLQAIWERQALSPTQAAQFANIDVATACSTWAGLLAAGVLQDHVYQALANHTLAHAEPSAQAIHVAAPPTVATQPSSPTSAAAAPITSPTPTVSQSSLTNQSDVQTASSAGAELPKGNMGGFLSRLRRKLGL